MRILHIAAGAGGMYCGACARDILLVTGLRLRGHEVRVVPLYTPLRIDGEEPFESDPVYMGGINLYLQQRSALFRRLPAALDRFLDNTALLRFVSRFAIDTRASELGAMTVAMLSGADGPFRKESDRLMAHLETEPPPEAVVITNTMLSGLAPAFKRRWGTPILCQVQGEDGFIGGMPEPHRSEAHRLLRENARSVDLFVSPNTPYAAQMVDYLGIAEADMRVVRTGLPAEDYAPTGPRPREPFTIGFLSGIARGKGLDLLVEAWRKLVLDEGRDAHLRVAGRPLDAAYWRETQARAMEATLAAKFEYAGEIDFAEKVRFLHGCSAFSVPSRHAEVRGRAVMEAMAAGVPVVVPASGVYPEMLSLTGGGLLFAAEDVGELAAALRRLMDDADEADRLGREGTQGIAEHYSPQQSTEGMAAVLGELVRG
jgi:glycosyltransferase involved in cell wall biosynthesis